MPATYWTLERLGMLERMKASAFPRKYSVQFFSPGGRASSPFYFYETDPEESSQTWQVLRSEFDRLLLDNAVEKGVEVRFGSPVEAVLFEGEGEAARATGVRAALDGGPVREIAARVVVDASEWMVENAINDAAVSRLRRAGIEVWRAPTSVTTHAKVLRCDGAVLVSDANWSYSGLALMRGTSLLATMPALVAQVEAWMDGVRAESMPVEQGAPRLR